MLASTHSALAVLLPRSTEHFVSALLHRQRTLTLYAAAMLILAVLTLAVMQLDDRTVRDVNVWAKPFKFTTGNK